MSGVKIMSGKWLSVVELSEGSDVPESTTRRYLTRFEEFFQGDGKVRGQKYHPDSIAILTRIKSLYDAGSQTDEIKDILAREFPMTIIEDDKEEPPPQIPPYATKEDIEG